MGNDSASDKLSGPVGAVQDTAPIRGDFSVVALRIQFQSDTSDLTTGDGRFDLSPTPGGVDTLIDPPPHNRTYFGAHLRALDNYYRRASSRLVGLDLGASTILPEDEGGAYTLDAPMSSYGRGFSDSTQQAHWAALVYDSYRLARNEVDFSQFSTLVLFHAGVGQDFDIPLDESPFDIQSSYLDTTFLRNHLSPDHYADLRSAGITHVLVLPETQNQLDVRIGLTGTFALLFGSRIGLPALYNTENGNTVIGKFGLMDLGSNNANGIAPALPSAWMRYQAGWDEAQTVTRPGEYAVSIPGSTTEIPSLLRIPISGEEYFLVENRRRSTINPTYDKFTTELDTLYIRRDPEGSGVITEVEHYDAGLPGSGLLIWHIDEQVIQTGRDANAINAGPERYGVDLEEADGAQDIGQDYGLLGGGSENGWAFDMWFAGNDGYFHLNPEFETGPDSTIAFTPTSHPATKTNSGAYTGISVRDIPAADSVMGFQVDLDRSISGFPFTVDAGALRHFHSFRNDKSINMVGATGSGTLWSGTVSGDSIISGIYDLPHYLDTTVEIGDIAIQNSESGVTVVVTAIFTPLEGGEKRTRLFTMDLLPDPDSTWTSPGGFQGEPAGQLIAGPDQIICTSDHDSAFSYSYNGDLRWHGELPGKVNSITLSAEQTVMFATEEGVYRRAGGDFEPVIDGEAIRTLISVNAHGLVALGEEQLYYHTGSMVVPPNESDALQIVANIGGLLVPPGSVRASDLDRDGQIEILFLGKDTEGKWQMYARNTNGTTVNNFPIPLEGQYSGTSLLIGDYNDDSAPELFVSDLAGLIHGFDLTGSSLPGYPVDVGLQYSGTPALVTLANTRAILIYPDVERGVSGYYAGIDPDLTGGEMEWTGLHGDPGQRRAVRTTEDPPPVTDALTIRRAYIYPNPVEGEAATIRVEFTGADRIELEIFDFGGRSIYHWEQEAAGENRVVEHHWSTEGLPSGVYLGKVTVSNGGEEKRELIKIALVR